MFFDECDVAYDYIISFLIKEKKKDNVTLKKKFIRY